MNSLNIQIQKRDEWSLKASVPQEEGELDESYQKRMDDLTDKSRYDASVTMDGEVAHVHGRLFAGDSPIEIEDFLQFINALIMRKVNK